MTRQAMLGLTLLAQILGGALHPVTNALDPEDRS